ncbi:stalk domain-containing protein [Cohnella sp. REN36]|uniref:stalk domain-containing protein n=1 Tax=Cohnella sp. REN36 TaxID=2887347 RepID=UPI001D13D60B|nr:stalk domain-containing protein [Cohnella sp. REN36]MCC3373362.1 copper amine oxidase N-terminal domain-containing protein [Cohnella sp. REN36]
MAWNAKKQRLLTLLAGASLLAAAVPPVHAEGTYDATSTTGNILTLTANKAQLTLNGVVYPTAQPTAVVAGVTYAPLSSLAARYGYSVRYDVGTKESIAVQGTTEIRMKAGSTTFSLNGKKVDAAGKSYNQKGSLMIPVRMWSNLTGSKLSVPTKGQVTLAWSTAPTADFKVDQTEIYAGQTQVTYTSLSQFPDKIVDERWEGNEAMFAEPGTYTVTRSVMDATYGWSAPYSITVTVRPPNQPPQATFATDKEIYKIGEPIQYTDQSTDDENAITGTEWTNKRPAFFTEGPQTISLKVTDRHGAVGEISKTITITSEVMYTEEQFNQRFTPIGEKYPIVGADVLKMQTVPYTYTVSDRALIASDSPEDFDREGVLYRDSMIGDFRLFLYHQNIGTEPFKIYLAATNESAVPATVTLGARGQAGPDSFGAYTGKVAASRYLISQDKGDTTAIALAPGETKLVAQELGSLPLKPGQVFSAYADLNASSDVKFTLFAVKNGKDPLATLGSLPVLPRDGKHIRGTFHGADREVSIAEPLGAEAQRVPFGDHSIDPALDGRDMLTGQFENNWGNFGVVYHTTVQVKANTLIAVNARGGIYSGVFKVNNTSVLVSNTSMLLDPNAVCVLYRTGPSDETVDLSFLTALGSNLPMNILFLPIR